MCKSKESNAKVSFGITDASMLKYGVLRYMCILLGVDNTPVNVGCYNSMILEARKKNKMF